MSSTDYSNIDSAAGCPPRRKTVDRSVPTRGTATQSKEELQAMLGLIVENSDDAIISKQLDGTITTWNRAAERLFRYPAADAIGNNMNMLLPPERFSEQSLIINRISRGEMVDHFQSQRLTRDGQLIDVALTISPIRDAGGKIIGVSTIARDITVQIRAERDRQESEAKLKALMDAAADGIITLDESATIQSVNEAIHQMFGFASSETLGQPVQLLMPHFWEKVLNTPQARVVSVDARRANGVTFPVEVSLKEWELNGKSIFTCIIRDVSDRKEAEARASEQQMKLAHLERIRTMGQMASGLAHELNQPLGAILNYSVVLKSMVATNQVSASDDEKLSILDDVIAQTTRAGEIIRRVRAFVKKQAPMVQARDINALVRDSVAMLNFDLRHAGLSPTLRLATDLPAAQVDRVLIQQVLVNLVHNAIDAMAEVDRADRQLEVSTTLEADGGISVNVSDNGCGIPPESFPRIFDSFFTTKKKGLGMGLSLCRTIVEEHGGHLRAQHNPNGGMTFSFSLKPAPSVEHVDTGFDIDRALAGLSDDIVDTRVFR